MLNGLIHPGAPQAVISAVGKSMERVMEIKTVLYWSLMQDPMDKVMYEPRSEYNKEPNPAVIWVK